MSRPGQGLRMMLVVPTLQVGGSERHAVGLASALVSDGGHALLVCLRDSGPLEPKARSAGVTVESLGLAGVADPSGPGRLGLLVARFRPHVLHSCLFGFDLMAALPARLLRVPLVVSARRELGDWMRGHHRVVEAAGNLLSDLVVCCSDAVRRRVLLEGRLDPARVVTVRNGVDGERLRLDPSQRAATRGEWGLAPDETLITTVANFDREKGYPVLLEAAARVLKQRPQARFVWAGEGPLLAEMERRVKARGLDSRVWLPGHVDDVGRLLSATDIFVLASLSEGLPNVVLEAMACQRPVVATRVGGVPEILEHRHSGLVVPAGDAVALARAILELGADSALASRLGAAGRQRALAWPERESHACTLRLYRAHLTA